MSDREKLHRLTGFMVEDILSLSDEEIIAEVIADGEDPKEIASRMRALFEKAIERNRTAAPGEDGIDRVLRLLRGDPALAEVVAEALLVDSLQATDPQIVAEDKVALAYRDMWLADTRLKAPAALTSIASYIEEHARSEPSGETIETLRQERDDYRADYLRVHKDKCDLLEMLWARGIQLDPAPTDEPTRQELIEALEQLATAAFGYRKAVAAQSDYNTWVAAGGSLAIPKTINELAKNIDHARSVLSRARRG